MWTPRFDVPSRAVLLLLMGYLACDAFWLIGDAAPLRKIGASPYLQAIAWLSALALSFGYGAVFSRTRSVLTSVAMVAATAFAAGVVIVGTGLMFFPTQFPRDSDWDQVLAWLFIVSVVVAAAFGLAAALGAVVSRIRSKL